MRTSKNVRACRRGGRRIFYQSASFSLEQENFFLPADGYDANKLLEDEGSGGE